MARVPTKAGWIALLLALCLALSGCTEGLGESLPSQSPPPQSAPASSSGESSQPEEPGAGKAAIYLYLCGSNLETRNAAATGNIAELLEAKLPENTSVVIETGGSEKWRDYDIPADSLTRYEIKNGSLHELQRLENASMGVENTLTEFLDFCASEYPAERTALILWDHGGGALGEICYDENFSMDPLTPEELAGALSGRHFDLIGFDACLMATNETAAQMEPFADYLLASEEIEPTGGWNYTALAESFSAETSLEEIGRAVCDSYLEKCSGSVGGDLATLSLLDLRHYGAFAAAFDAFAAGLSQTAGEKYGNFNIVYASQQAPKFGAASRDEGSSNLIDLYSFADSLAEKSAGAQALTEAIEALVPYRVNGEMRGGLGGVSLFFPQSYVPEELEDYFALCSSEAYRNYLSEIYGEVEYSIVFEDMGSVDESGNFHVKLSEESRRYLKSVEFSLLQLSYDENREDHTQMVCLGEDNDLESDWENLEFTSNFRGIWLALDGVYLNYSVVESSDDHILFSAPVEVNGQRGNLRFLFVWDENYPGGGYYKLIGLWNGLDENHLADRQIVPLRQGDQVTVLQKRIDPATDVTIAAAPLTPGETVTIGADGGKIQELPLRENSQYRYIFIADDIFGNRIYSDTAYFSMLYTYDQLLENPVPDGECAAEITDIVWDSFWGTVG